MDLTIGPNAFFWTAEAVRAFYRAVAASPVSRVVVGEWVCSKRLPFWQDEIPGAVEALQLAGKQVAITSLALITLPRERRQTAELVEMGLPVEINDLSALRHIPERAEFWVGPVVNVYNEGTLDWLARAPPRPSSPSTAARSPSSCSNPSCSVTSRAPSPARRRRTPGFFRPRTAARFSSTKSATCRWPCR